VPVIVVAACHPKLFATFVSLVVETGHLPDNMDKTPSILSHARSNLFENFRALGFQTRTKLTNFASPCGTPGNRDKTAPPVASFAIDQISVHQR